MSLKFKTNSILDTLFSIAISGYDYDIAKRTKGRIDSFCRLNQAGTIIILFDENNKSLLRDSNGRFIKEGGKR